MFCRLMLVFALPLFFVIWQIFEHFYYIISGNTIEFEVIQVYIMVWKYQVMVLPEIIIYFGTYGDEEVV